LRCGVGAAKHPAPRLAEEVEAPIAQAETVDKVVEFADEEVFDPEGFVVFLFREVRGETIADLIVEDYRDGVLGDEVREGEEVVMACSWPAVCYEKRCVAVRCDVANDFVVCFARLVDTWDGEVNGAFADGRGSLLYGVEVIYMLEIIFGFGELDRAGDCCPHLELWATHIVDRKHRLRA